MGRHICSEWTEKSPKLRMERHLLKIAAQCFSAGKCDKQSQSPARDDRNALPWVLEFKVHHYTLLNATKLH